MLITTCKWTETRTHQDASPLRSGRATSLGLRSVEARLQFGNDSIGLDILSRPSGKLQRGYAALDKLRLLHPPPHRLPDGRVHKGRQRLDCLKHLFELFTQFRFDPDRGNRRGFHVVQGIALAMQGWLANQLETAPTTTRQRPTSGSTGESIGKRHWLLGVGT